MSSVLNSYLLFFGVIFIERVFDFFIVIRPTLLRNAKLYFEMQQVFEESDESQLRARLLDQQLTDDQDVIQQNTMIRD